MANQIKRTLRIDPESDYEIHRLAKLWDVPVTQARQICHHYTAAQTDGESRQFSADIAAIRQAEAKVEILTARK